MIQTTTTTTNHYTATQQEGERNAHVQQDWVREVIRESDLILWRLEELNRDGVKQAPEELRVRLCALGMRLGLARNQWPLQVQELLNLVFDEFHKPFMGGQEDEELEALAG